MPKRTVRTVAASLSVLPPDWRQVSVSEYDQIPKPDMSRMSPLWTEDQARAETEAWKREAFSSFAIRDKNKQWYYIRPREEDDLDSPLSLWQRYRQIDAQAAQHAAGECEILFAVASECLRNDWPLPAWVKTSLQAGFDRYCRLDACSLDEAFKIARRTHLAARKTQRKLAEIFDYARQTGLFGEELPQSWKRSLAKSVGGSQANVRKHWESYRKQIRDKAAASAVHQLSGWARGHDASDATKDGNS